MAFVIEKTVQLDKFGKGWEGASITLNSLSFRESEELAELSGKIDPNNASAEGNKLGYTMVSDILQKKFSRGQAFDGEKLVELTPETLVELPAEIISEILQSLMGNLSPNSLNP